MILDRAAAASAKVAQVDTLRVFINVPQLYASGIHPGMHGPTRVREVRDRIFEGVIARTSNELDTTNRSLLTEVDIPNPDGALIAGMYARVTVDASRTDRPILVPSMTICAIAERASTSKVTVHRWWSHKAAIVLEAMLSETTPQMPYRESSSALESLRGQMKSFAQFLEGPNGRLLRKLELS